MIARLDVSCFSQADLIHLGARYSPCMRADENVIGAIEQHREMERGSACCIRNDGSGCHQTTSGAACSVSSAGPQCLLC